ncbi:MAG: hypothetical protein ACXV3F_15985 [Frankiaceae bacterium]
MADFEPTLTVIRRDTHVCMSLGALATGRGATLDEAEQDLVRRLRAAAVAIHDYGILGGTEGPPPDIAALSFLYQLGEIAAAGGDIRTRLSPSSGFSP